MPTPLLELVPHRPPMLLLDEVTDLSADQTTVLGTVREDSPFLCPDGSLDPLACPELIAQASAAFKSLHSRAGGGGRVGGMLVGIRDFAFHAPQPRRGDRLRVVMREGSRHQALAVASGEVWVGESLAAAGELRLFLDERPIPVSPNPAEVVPAGSSVFPLWGRWGELLASSPPGSPAASFTLPAQFPAFAGHFPGKPILPAVAIAMLAVETARAASGGGRLRLLSWAKFSRPVVPGETLEARCARKGPGAWSATVRAGEAVAAELSFELTSP